jgi:hypothetical protein
LEAQEIYYIIAEEDAEKQTAQLASVLPPATTDQVPSLPADHYQAAMTVLNNHFVSCVNKPYKHQKIHAIFFQEGQL